jgi:tRNA(Arg) A34 adenosine deaminase TadA
VPAPTLFEYAAKVVSLLAAKDGRYYAFLLSKDEVLCAGAHTGSAEATYQTALINGMQNNVALFKKKPVVWALCSYAPTAMCKGMACSVGVEATLYSDGGAPAFSKVKGGLSQPKFNAGVPTLAAECGLKTPFTWNANPAAALQQAADPTQFNEAARKLLTALQTKAAAANSTRLKESSAIEGALKDVPKGDPPGAGTFGRADEVYAHLVFGMVGQSWNPTAQNIDKKTLESGEAQMGNNIAGILLDERFNIVAWALNFAGENPTFHAETLMLQYYLREKGLQKLPPNYKIYTSLQPCDMCGSFILHVGNNTEVVYCLRDVTLETVLTKSKTVATERLVVMSATTEMKRLLAEKFALKKTHTAALLTDAQDQTYRKLMLQKKAGMPTAMPTIQDASPFKYEKDHMGELDAVNKKRLAFEFVKSADQIMAWANADDDPKRKKAAQQGVEVFEALVTHGFTTAYGLKITDLLFSRIFAKNKPADVVERKTAGVVPVGK